MMKSCFLFACLAVGLTAGAFETDSLKPFPVTRPVAAELRDEHRAFQSAPSVTISRGGRLWCAWHTGVTAAEGSDNCMVVVTSGDGGRSWSKPLFSIDAEGLLRVLDPGLWTDPDGRVWLFYSQLYEFWDGRAGVWAMQPLDPEREDSEWTPARRLCDGYLKNKPLVARDGSWLLPVEFMHRECRTMAAAANMAAKFAFPVMYQRMVIEERGKYRIEYELICEDASKMPVEEIMQRFYDLLTKDIEAQPENYLWTHRRWA